MMTRNDIENSKHEACERAKAEGKAEGAAENSREVARKMKVDGLEPSLIAKYSGLSLEETNEL